ncbi:MAG: hypothetical protein Q7V62_17685 [Actinomycetota bacterium]|nr:hypothetical protein [Actinomycetota bacterium]
MTTRSRSWHRAARQLARVGTVVSAAMLVVSIATSFGPGAQFVDAATNAGGLDVLVPPGTAAAGQPLTAGGSATAFALAPPEGAACSGDSATGGYRVQTYMVPASVDLDTLTFGLTGPIPSATGANYRQPLYTSAGSSRVNKTTAVNTGLLIGLPILSFEWIGTDGTTVLPAGTYNLGYACTKGAASATQLDKYWNVQFTVTAAAADVPAGLAWSVSAAVPTTTTTSTTVGATTTTGAGATTTTTGSGTTTTVSGSTTTTIRATTTTVRVSSGAGGGSGSGGGTIVATGGSPLPTLLWAVLLLVFGRMVILLGRPLRVLPPDAS